MISLLVQCIDSRISRHDTDASVDTIGISTDKFTESFIQWCTANKDGVIIPNAMASSIMLPHLTPCDLRVLHPHKTRPFVTLHR